MTDTIGQRLKKARKYRNLTIEKAAAATRIRQSYLQALESDDFNALPSPVQARGFLRNYAQYLDLDLDQILEELRATQSEQKSGAEPEVLFEGDQDVPSPVKEEIQPKVETEETPPVAPAEPFWQTWLRRAKREIGDLEAGEQVTYSPGSFGSAPEQTDQDKVAEAQPANGLESPAIPESNLEMGSSQKIDEESVQNGAKADLLIERMKSLFPRRRAKPTPIVEVVEASEPEPMPEPEPEIEPEPREPATASQEIINEIASQLRRRREMLSLSLDEIERHTRLRVEIMEALEKGNFEDLPSPVQMRGMLANYAGFLDLDVDALLLRFADALQARHRERHPEKPAKRRGQPIIPENLPRFRTFIAGDVVFGIGMAVLLVGFSVWGISRVISIQSEDGTGKQTDENGLSISEALIGTPVVTVESEVTLIPAEDTPIPSLAADEPTGEATIEAPALETTANVQINIVALERSFLRVTVDGEVAFEGRTIPGNAYPFEADESIEILAGNGSALRVIYNQRDLGLLGGFGQIASFLYTADEIVTPTPAMSPTVTNTPFISPTPTITPSPTVTPSPTPTQADLPVDV